MEIFDIIKCRRSISPEFFNTKKIKKKEIDLILESSNWAPTHKKTEPWRFKIIKDKSKILLGQFLSKKYEQTNENFSKLKFNKIINKCKKSSIILIICMHRDPLLRIPEWEEIASVSMAVQNMWLTATSLKIGAFWSTPSYIKYMNEHISLNHNEKCLGIFYLGYYDNFNVTRIPNPIEKKIETL
tara:strand:+ start:903 stop:1457 length:555 start_codon:yes stop_codon:yes gene_type:complete